jgi:hypothetical protein
LENAKNILTSFCSLDDIKIKKLLTKIDKCMGIQRSKDYKWGSNVALCWFLEGYGVWYFRHQIGFHLLKNLTSN